MWSSGMAPHTAVFLHSNIVNNWKKSILEKGKTRCFSKANILLEENPGAGGVVLGQALCPQPSCAHQALLEGAAPAGEQDVQGWEMLSNL